MTRAAKRSTCGEDCDWRVRKHEIHQKFSKMRKGASSTDSHPKAHGTARLTGTKASTTTSTSGKRKERGLVQKIQSRQERPCRKDARGQESTRQRDFPKGKGTKESQCSSLLFSLNGIWCMRLHAVRAYKHPGQKVDGPVWYMYRSTLRRSFGALARCQIMTKFKFKFKFESTFVKAANRTSSPHTFTRQTATHDEQLSNTLFRANERDISTRDR